VITSTFCPPLTDSAPVSQVSQSVVGVGVVDHNGERVVGSPTRSKRPGDAVERHSLRDRLSFALREYAAPEAPEVYRFNHLRSEEKTRDDYLRREQIEYGSAG